MTTPDRPLPHMASRPLTLPDVTGGCALNIRRHPAGHVTLTITDDNRAPIDDVVLTAAQARMIGWWLTDYLNQAAP